MRDFYEIPVKENFQTSATRYWDLLHTRLDIAFDMEQEHVLGEAELTLTPYFYTQDDLTLNAKGMDIHALKVNSKDVEFTYDGQQLYIELASAVTKGKILRFWWITRLNHLNLR